jgi:hypothetical protein
MREAESSDLFTSLQQLLLLLSYMFQPVTVVKLVTTTDQRPRVDPCGINVLSAVRGEYRACSWTEDFLLVSDKET